MPDEPPTKLRSYELGKLNPNAELPFNCDGWNLQNGAVQPAVTLFASDPQCVILSLLSSQGSQITDQDLAPIQAKIGLEYLERESIEIQSDKATLVFRGPRRLHYQSGLQVCFLGFIRPEDLGRKSPPLHLASVSFARQTSTIVESDDGHTERGL